MDSDLALLALQMQADQDEADDQERELAAVALLLIIVVGAQESRTHRIQRQHLSRLYLCRSQLLPDPHGGTPWQWLQASHSDRAFITMMGFDVNTFEYILQRGFGTMWQDSPIPRNDTNVSGNACPDACSLDGAGTLGLVLHYLNSTMWEVSLQQIFVLVLSTVSRYITFGLKILADVLPLIPETRITWPTKLSTLRRYESLITSRHPLLTCASGAVTPGVCHEGEYEVHQTAQETLTTIWNQ